MIFGDQNISLDRLNINEAWNQDDVIDKENELFELFKDHSVFCDAINEG